LLRTLPPDLAREGGSLLAADKSVPEREKEQNSTELSGSYRAAIMGALYACGNSPSKLVQEEPAACPPLYIFTHRGRFSQLIVTQLTAWHRFFPGGHVCPPLHLISGLIILFSVEECSPLRNIFWGAKRGLPIPRRLPDPCAGYLEHQFQKIGDVCHEKQEGANLCSMDRQADM